MHTWRATLSKLGVTAVRTILRLGHYLQALAPHPQTVFWCASWFPPDTHLFSGYTPGTEDSVLRYTHDTNLMQTCVKANRKQGHTRWQYILVIPPPEEHMRPVWRTGVLRIRSMALGGEPWARHGASNRWAKTHPVHATLFGAHTWYATKKSGVHWIHRKMCWDMKVGSFQKKVISSNLFPAKPAPCPNRFWACGGFEMGRGALAVVSRHALSSDDTVCML